MRLIVFAIAALALGTQSSAVADEKLCTIPGGTHLQFHVNAPIASNESKSGQSFAFTLTDPIAGTACTIPAAGAKGAGTIVLAGASGPHGHEGDLTLTLDTIRTADGRTLTFDDQVLEINGGNKKVESGALNVVPDVGIAAIFIRGKDVRIDPTTPVNTILLHDAVVRVSESPAP